MPIRNKTLKYPPLDKVFSPDSCSVEDITELNMSKSYIQSVRTTSAQDATYHQVTEDKPIARFYITYKPHDDKDKGWKLIPEAEKLVRDVLGADYKAKETAVITQTSTTGEGSTTQEVHDCFITSVEIDIPSPPAPGEESTHITIMFHLEGLLVAGKS